MLNRMRISQLAGQAGVTTKTLRYYERIGLLPAPKRRRAAGHDYEAVAASCR